MIMLIKYFDRIGIPLLELIPSNSTDLASAPQQRQQSASPPPDEEVGDYMSDVFELERDCSTEPELSELSDLSEDDDVLPQI